MKCWMQTPVFKEPGSSGHGVVPEDHGLLAELFLPDRLGSAENQHNNKACDEFCYGTEKGLPKRCHTCTYHNRSTRVLAYYAEKRYCNPCYELGFAVGKQAWIFGLNT